MTWEEKIEIFREKQEFVEQLSKVFKVTKHNSTVEGFSYEVYHKSFSDRLSETREYVVVCYTGGAKAPRTVSGYSCTAVYRFIGELLSGGYYDEVREYESLLEEGYERIKL